MKKYFIPLVLLVNTVLFSQQNEFANTNFYEAVKKINADAEEGFPLYKGAAIKNAVLSGIIDEYKAKLMLPGADSGKITTTLLGNWFAEYYFSGGSSLEASYKKRANLLEAVQTALGKKLYEKSETSKVKDVTFYKVYYFFNANQTLVFLSEFESSVFFDRGKYILTFKINWRGKNSSTKMQERKSSLTLEPDLDNKTLSFLNEATSCFSALKTSESKKDDYNTYYNINKTLFGIKGVVEEGKYECTLRFSIGFTEFSNLDEAIKIFNQLRNSLARQLGNRISFSSEEKSAFNPESFSVTGMDTGKNTITSKNRISLIINKSNDFPSVYLYFNKKKY